MISSARRVRTPRGQGPLIRLFLTNPQELLLRSFALLGLLGTRPRGDPIQNIGRHHSCTIERRHLGSARHRTRLRHMGCCYVPVRQARQSGWDTGPSALGIGHYSPLALKPRRPLSWQTDILGTPRFRVLCRSRHSLSLVSDNIGLLLQTSRMQLTK